MSDSPLRIRDSSVPSQWEEDAAAWFHGGQTFDPREYLRVLLKRRRLIAAFFLVVVLAVALFTFMATPIYTAETLLLIERRPSDALDLEAAVAESLGWKEGGFYQTQYRILRSRDLAAQVISEEELEKEEFFKDPKKPGPEASGAASESMGFEGPEGTRPDSALISRYVTEMLDVLPYHDTRLVKLTFGTPDPELSARALAAHVRAYIRQSIQLRTQAKEEARQVLERNLASLKRRIEESEAELNDYRIDKRIISLDDKENVVVSRLGDLNKRLTEAEADRIGYEAQAGLIRERQYDALPAVINSALIQKLTEQLAKVEGEYANLATRFKPGYSRLAQIRAQVVELRRRLSLETQSIVGGIESAHLAAIANERELRSTLEEQKDAALRLKDASVQFVILQREAETNRQLYDSVLERMKELGVTAQLRASNIFVIDEPYPPLKPSKPRKKLNLALAMLIGLLGGVGLALLAEYLDDTVKTPQEVERQLGLPNLGIVPDLQSPSLQNQPRLAGRAGTLISRISGGRDDAELDLDLEPNADSVVTEAYRAIRTGILLSRAGEPPRTILFTSAMRGEGKTVTSLNTAIMFAQLGPPVLVIDADLRRPRVHRGLGLENDTGLTEVLTGQVDLVKAIRPMSSSLSLMLSGSKPPNPTELLGSDVMRELLESLQRRYSYILIDAPPVMPVSDSVVLSTLVDGVVLVVDQSQTPKQTIRQARARLTSARAKLLGVVLNRLDPAVPGYSQYVQGYYS